MQFNTILVPVDFTVNTRVAIEKAIAICDGPNPAIHVIHVPEPTSVFGNYRIFFTDGHYADEREDSRLQLRLKECLLYISKLRSDITTCYWISYSTSVERAIKEKAVDIAADLIIIGKNSRHSVLPFLNTVVPSRLSKSTGISVLTVKPGALSSHVKTVVVPISPKHPEKKVAVINGLGNKFHLHIRLLLLVEKDDDPQTLQNSLLNMCQMLKYRALDTISYEVLYAGNRNWGILRYSRSVEADLLIVNPETETKIGWFNKHISDELPVNSKTQVLAVGRRVLSLAK